MTPHGADTVVLRLAEVVDGERFVDEADVDGTTVRTIHPGAVVTPWAPTRRDRVDAVVADLDARHARLSERRTLQQRRPLSAYRAIRVTSHGVRRRTALHADT